MNEVSEDGEEEYASDGERALTGESNKIKGKNYFYIMYWIDTQTMLFDILILHYFLHFMS